MNHPAAPAPGPAPGPGGSPPMPPGAPPPGAPPAADSKGKRKGKDKGDASKATRRGVSRQLLLALLFAVVAGGAILVVAGDDTRTAHVVVADTAIPARSVVGEAVLTVEERVVDDRLEELVVDRNVVYASPDPDEAMEIAREDLAGMVTQYPIPAGQIIRREAFTRESATLGVDLGPDERMVSLTVPATQAVAGTLQPGDHVDVLAINTDGETVGAVIGTDVPLVAVDGGDLTPAAPGSEDGADPTEVPETYTLRVPATHAQRYAIASATMDVHLLYRGVDAADLDAIAATPLDVLCQGALEAGVPTGDLPAGCDTGGGSPAPPQNPSGPPDTGDDDE